MRWGGSGFPGPELRTTDRVAESGISRLFTSAEKPEFLKAGDVAVVKIKPTRPTVVEAAKEFPQLGRFAIRDMGQTVAAGMVIEVKKKAM